MITKDGKLFGKISLVDIAVVLIIVILGIGICCRFTGETKVAATSGDKFSATFIVRNVREYTADALSQGGAVYDKTSKEFIGDITDVRQEAGLYQVNMADGSFENAIPDERYNVYVTVEFTGKSNDNGYYTAANKYLGAGTSVNITTKYAECESTVYSIEKIN